MSFQVTVRATWEGHTPFEFNTREEAAAFVDAVNRGELEAIVDAGDIDSGNVSLLDFEVAGEPAVVG